MKNENLVGTVEKAPRDMKPNMFAQTWGGESDFVLIASQGGGGEELPDGLTSRRIGFVSYSRDAVSYGLYFLS
jgi:hypothetical protein